MVGNRCHQKKPGELVEYLPEKGKIEVRSNKNITKILRILTNVNILQETLKNIESFAIIEQLQDVDKYE